MWCFFPAHSPGVPLTLHTDMSSRQKKPDARALFKQAKSRKGENGASLGSSVGPGSLAGRGASSSSSVSGGKYVGKSKEEVSYNEDGSWWC